MAKPQKEMISIPPHGRWKWSDETQALEFSSSDSSVEMKDKRKQTKPNIQERLAQSAVAARGRISVQSAVDRRGIGESYSLNAQKSDLKKGQRPHVTIAYVKQVALSILQQNESRPVPLCFLTVVRSPELDHLLAALLLYLSCYFEKTTLEKKPNPLMAEQSVTELQALAEARAKVDLAQMPLAFCYSTLVLGVGLSQQHHMACGRSRASSTYRDRQLFECLYSFLCYAAWVTFGRRDLKGIQEEVWRLLRSDTFNPALRTRKEVDDKVSSPKLGKMESKEPSPLSHCRRRTHRRPALSSMVTQRSPVMVALLPSPREGAPHLFVRSRLLREPQTKPCNTDALIEELSSRLTSLSFGILGKPLREFSSTSLKPQEGEDGNDEDEEYDADEENLAYRTSHNDATFGSHHSLSGSLDKYSSPSRANTAVSRATTEGVYSDTD